MLVGLSNGTSERGTSVRCSCGPDSITSGRVGACRAGAMVLHRQRLLLRAQDVGRIMMETDITGPVVAVLHCM